MLQNPSKYHTSHPLSQFLALHNSAAAAAAAAAVVSSHHNHHQHQQYMQQSYGSFNQHHNHHHQHNHSRQEENFNSNNNNNNNFENENSHYHHLHHHLRGGPEWTTDARVATTFDVGKSFTIAAILGLQKNAIETSQNEFNNVMNLSLSGHYQKTISGINGISSNCGSNNYNNKTNISRNVNENNSNNNNNNNNNNSSNNNNVYNKNINANSNHNNNNNANDKNIIHATHNSRLDYSVNNKNFNCDNINAVIAIRNNNDNANKYVTGDGIVPANIDPALTLNHFTQQATTSAVPAAAATVNGNTSSALQSLQQLQQHHVQQTVLNFQQRERIKIESIAVKKSSLKSKRVRTIFTPEQLERLEAEFERQQYMVGPERLYLAHTLQLTEAQVKVWFQNRRIKWRKHHLELTQQRLALIRQSQITNNPTNNENGSNADNTTLMPGINRRERDILSANRINPNIPENLINLSSQELDTKPQNRDELSICNDSMDTGSINEDDEG